MEAIFAPWRMTYINGKKPDHCVFCERSSFPEDLILLTGATSFVMLNRYPYTCGHLMIIPTRHLSRMEDLSLAEKVEIFDLLDVSVRVLKEAMEPDGFNIGMNLGKAAGAGIDDHIHIHVVPRWNGDTNFMSVVSEIRIIPEDVIRIGERLMPYFNKYHREV